MTDQNQILLQEIAGKKATGKNINIEEIIDMIDVQSDYTKIKEWILSEKICSRSEWNNLLNVKQVKNELGNYPKTAKEYLNLWVKNHKLKVNYRKDIISDEVIYHDGLNVDEEINKIKLQIEECRNALQLEKLNYSLRKFEEIKFTKSTILSIPDLNRNMRIKAKELGLSFSRIEIDDVISQWIEEEKPKRRYEIFSDISYKNGIESNPEIINMWSMMISSCFDTTSLSHKTIESVLKKFIWQVKRKMQKLPVTRHLMPVILGPQNKGKTTFINMFTEPLQELRSQVDFKQITDQGTIDLWDNYVLIFDEMGYASKADISMVKNYITTDYITRRYYYSNTTGNIKQNATFIGASNKELNQLIRDETGIRRFMGINFSPNPDWDTMNRINYKLLWRSVDERGIDPSLECIDDILLNQEEMREKSPCEEWSMYLYENNQEHLTRSASVWYRDYYCKWQEIYNTRKIDFSDWKKEMLRLIKSNNNFPFKYHYKTNGICFTYKKAGH